MTKLIFLSTLLFLLVSCNSSECDNKNSTVQKAEASTVAACPTPEPEPTPDPTPEPAPDLGDVPNEALTFDASVQLFEFDASQEEKLQKAIEVIKKVVASEEFRDRVLSFTFQGKKQFNDNKGMSNEQIYEALLAGKEDLKPEVDNEMDLELQLYYSWRNTVGYTTPGNMRIYMNTKFFNPYTVSEVAGNVFHEWTHKLGFEHATTYSTERDFTVPYGLGYIIRELGKKYE